jgi:hypothetical protein
MINIDVVLTNCKNVITILTNYKKNIDIILISCKKCNNYFNQLQKI